MARRRYTREFKLEAVRQENKGVRFILFMVHPLFIPFLWSAAPTIFNPYT